MSPSFWWWRARMSTCPPGRNLGTYWSPKSFHRIKWLGETNKAGVQETGSAPHGLSLLLAVTRSANSKSFNAGLIRSTGEEISPTIELSLMGWALLLQGPSEVKHPWFACIVKMAFGNKLSYLQLLCLRFLGLTTRISKQTAARVCPLRVVAEEIMSLSFL